MKFKCPDYYCIPWSYVCDGKWDCPNGIDEFKEHNCSSIRECHNMFKCEKSQVCIHLGDVCDGHFDCTLGDDEYFCSLKSTLCPSGCNCLTFVLRCFRGEKLPVSDSPYYIIYIEMSSFAFIADVLTKIDKIVILSLKHNDIVTLCSLLPSLQNTLIIDVGNNKINMIEYKCFSNTMSLRQIKINNNNLKRIKRKSFYNLANLLFLNLAENSLHLLPINMLNNCPSLQILNIYHNNFISNIVFRTLEVKK